MQKIKLLIVDDHSVVRSGLSYLLNNYPQFNIVGDAATAAESVSKTLELQPDVVLMDIRLPDKKGTEACQEIMKKSPNTKVIMLTSYDDDELIIKSIIAGAKGYVLKNIDDDELVRAITVVNEGGSLLDPTITEKLFQYMVENKLEAYPEIIKKDSVLIPKEVADLNKRELQILKFIAKGMTNKEIGFELNISYKTVKNYVTNIFAKLGCSNRTEAAGYALKHMLV